MTAVDESHETPWQHGERIRAAQRRTVRLLSAAQIAGGVGVGVSVSIGPLLAESVAHSETYAGLARTATAAGAAAVGVPLALLAHRRGRRAALGAGWAAAAVGGAVLITSAVVNSVPLLITGMLLFGIGSATNQQSRYAAADLAAPGSSARALSIVVWSTTIGSVIGPNLAAPGARVASALQLPPLAGPFVLGTACTAVAGVLLWARLRPDPLLLARELTEHSSPSVRAQRSGTLRASLRYLRQTPRAGFAFVAVVMAHTLMAAVMTMTPVSMAEDGAALTVVGITISGHLLGMYAFSPLVGWLADRFGRVPVVLAGQLLFLASVLLSGLAHGSVALVMTGLFLLGLGWSFCLVAGSAMLSDATPAGLRPGVQGSADTMMNVVAAVGAGLAGPLMGVIGFGGLNAVAGVLVLPVLLAWTALERSRRTA